MRSRFVFSIAAIVLASSTAFGQSDVPAVWVSNNGNLEGSVTAFAVSFDGTVQFVNRIVTGMRATTSVPCAGCNAYEISLTPDGEYLATGHPAGDLDGITILKVNSNASISQVIQLPLGAGSGGPLDVAWLDNRLLAVTRLDPSPDQIAVYRFDPAVPSLTQLTTTSVGTSMGYLAAHPTGNYVYANNSSTKVVYAFSFDSVTGALTLIDTEPTGAPFPLELTISPDGTKMYCAGGISDGGNKVIGLDIALDGTLSLMPGLPFVSPGNSPSNVFVSGDGTILTAGHGTDATARTFTIDQATGALTSTGNSFDVGLQGTLGDVRMLDDLLFVTDNSTATDGVQGLYSFKVDTNGAMTMNGAITLTQGIGARSLATWKPRPTCIEDVTGDLVVSAHDLVQVIHAWGECLEKCPPSCQEDLDGDCVVGVPDLLKVINAWGPCPR